MKNIEESLREISRLKALNAELLEFINNQREDAPGSKEEAIRLGELNAELLSGLQGFLDRYNSIRDAQP